MFKNHPRRFVLALGAVLLACSLAIQYGNKLECENSGGVYMKEWGDPVFQCKVIHPKK